MKLYSGIPSTTTGTYPFHIPSLDRLFIPLTVEIHCLFNMNNSRN